MTDKIPSQLSHNLNREWLKVISWNRPCGHAFLAIILSLFLGLMTINKLTSNRLDADTILQSIISIQHLTLFYWGQDRFFNLVPILLSPIKNAATNLFLLILIFASAFYGLLIAIASVLPSYLSANATSVDRYLLAGIIIVVALILLSPDLLNIMSASAQPYALSYLFLIGPAWLWLKSIQTKGRIAVALICMAVATALNPSVLIIAIVIGSGSLLFTSRMRSLFFMSSALASFLCWMILAHFTQHHLEAHYFRLNLENIPSHLLKEFDIIAAQFSFPALKVLLGTVLVTQIFFPPNRRFVILLVLGFGFCLGWWALFSNHEWIEMNKFSIRYFSPICISICVGIGVALYLPLSRLTAGLKFTVIGLCAVAAVTLLAHWPSRPKDVEIIQRARSIAEYAKAKRIHFVSGDYWIVWPTVFMLLDRPSAAFGLTYRGEANEVQVRTALSEELGRDLTPQLLCLKDSTEQCAQMARAITGASWRSTETSCPGDCRVLQMVRDGG